MTNCLLRFAGPDQTVRIWNFGKLSKVAADDEELVRSPERACNIHFTLCIPRDSKTKSVLSFATTLPSSMVRLLTHPPRMWDRSMVPRAALACSDQGRLIASVADGEYFPEVSKLHYTLICVC